MTDERIEVLKNELKNSPVFALSLGGKEITHTNFLAFLLETENVEYLPVRKNLRNVFGIDEAATSICVEREKHNFDLLITTTSTGLESVVLIEAKFKSLPSKEQLMAYEDKITKISKYRKSKNKFFLLSIDANDFLKMEFSQSDVLKNWIPINWVDIIDAIESTIDANLHLDLLNMYVKSLSNVLEILKIEKDIFNSNRLTIGEISKRLKSYSDIRIYDLVSKHIMSYLIKNIKYNLPKILKTSVFSNEFFSNGKAGVEIYLRKEIELDCGLKYELSVGVQVEGSVYKHIMRVNFQNKEKKINNKNNDIVHRRFLRFINDQLDIWFYGNFLEYCDTDISINKSSNIKNKFAKMIIDYEIFIKNYINKQKIYRLGSYINDEYTIVYSKKDFYHVKPSALYEEITKSMGIAHDIIGQF
jgi:hypothetical protein